MEKHYTKKPGKVIESNHSEIRDHLWELVCGRVEETLLYLSLRHQTIIEQKIPEFSRWKSTACWGHTQKKRK